MMSGQGKGLLALVGFAVMSAAVDVIAGNRLQGENTFAVAAIAFTLVALGFLAGELPSRGARLRWCLTKYPTDVLGINVGTVLSWLPLLFALKLIEPAIANVVSVAIGPAIVVLLSPLLMSTGPKILGSEKLTAAGIVLVIGVLFVVAVDGNSAVGHRAVGPLMVGTGCAMLSGVGATLNVFYGKRLHLRGIPARTVMASRFFLVTTSSWICFFLAGTGELLGAAITGLVVAVLGLSLPMYTTQFALRYVEPITASVLMNLAPIFTFVFQFLDPRLHQSMLSLVCICLLAALVVTGVTVRTQQGGLTTDEAIASSHRTGDQEKE